MPTISLEELKTISAAFRDIRKAVETIKQKAPNVGALCENIERVSQPALKTIELVAQRREG